MAVEIALLLVEEISGVREPLAGMDRVSGRLHWNTWDRDE